VIIYKALHQSKKLKNADFTTYIVFYPILGARTGYPIGEENQSSKTR